MNKKRKHIELFAGCGGMAVGMKSAGYDLIFANEVSPMAANTFAKNLLKTNLENPSGKVKWLHSRFTHEDYILRLRENLLMHGKIENCDIDPLQFGELKDQLLIGDVRLLNTLLKENNIEDPYNGDLDLVSGGPPCQSFSLAGKRELRNYKNRLPLDFAEICERLNPKIVLLENVKGILSAFSDYGEKHYAWFEVAKAFALKGYAPLCMLINSKYFGIPQNRPRYIMVALRKDVFSKLRTVYPKNPILEKLHSFCEKASSDFSNLSLEDLDYYDLEKTPALFDGKILPKPTTFVKESWVSVKDAINDLSTAGSNQRSNYVFELNSLLGHNGTNGEVQNHNKRNHTFKVQKRFLFLQLLNHSGDLREDLIVSKKYNKKVGSDTITKLYKTLSAEIEQFNDLFPSSSQLADFIHEVDLTKKHSQRALVSSLPSPAQLTIPDDMCHYSTDQPRVLTVREMARIQSFPDWFLFKSKETTGGRNRKYEVPQYTQVGNAVPPKLAHSLGLYIQNILSNSDL